MAHDHMRSTNLFNKVVITALVCELTLVAIYWIDVLTGGHFQMLHSLFDLDSEGNIPAWFSSSQLFCVAISFWKNHRTSAVLTICGIAIALTGGMGVETLGYKLFQGHTESILYKVEVSV